MRVLLVHEFYQQYGGEDAVVENELDMLNRAGIETRLYSRHNDEIRDFGPMRMAACALTAIQSPRTRRDLSQIIREFRPDVAYLHNVYPLISPAAYDTLWSHGVPMVQVMHNFRPFCSNGLFYTHGEVCERCAFGNHWAAVVRGCVPRGRVITSVYAAALWWMRRAGTLDKIDAFLCLNSFVRQKLIEAGIPEAKLAVKANSIDLTGISADYHTADYALFLGRLAPEKGLHTLIGAARRNPALPVVIVGTGPLEGELRSAAADLPHVRFAGFQAGADKRELIRRAGFLVVCSEWYENFPVVVLEAFAAGKPVVASSLGSLPHLIDEGKTGLLFQAGSPIDLANKMALLSDSPELRRKMGWAARKCVEERYGRQHALSALTELFENVASRRAVERPGFPSPPRPDLGREIQYETAEAFYGRMLLQPGAIPQAGAGQPGGAA